MIRLRRGTTTATHGPSGHRRIRRIAAATHPQEPSSTVGTTPAEFRTALHRFDAGTTEHLAGHAGVQQGTAGLPSAAVGVPAVRPVSVMGTRTQLSSSSSSRSLFAGSMRVTRA